MQRHYFFAPATMGVRKTEGLTINGAPAIIMPAVTGIGDEQVLENYRQAFQDYQAREAETRNDLPTFGHAAVFNQETLIGSRRFGFVEEIAEGAFDEVLDNDVRFLINHEGLALARTANGTLRLSTDGEGLVSDADLNPGMTLSRDLFAAIERKDIDQMSFAFTIGSDDVEMLGEDHATFPGMPKRTITKVSRLFDVSAVTFPAFEGTDIAARCGVGDAEIRGIMERAETRAEDVEEASRDLIPQELDGLMVRRASIQYK